MSFTTALPSKMSVSEKQEKPPKVSDYRPWPSTAASTLTLPRISNRRAAHFSSCAFATFLMQTTFWKWSEVQFPIIRKSSRRVTYTLNDMQRGCSSTSDTVESNCQNVGLLQSFTRQYAHYISIAVHVLTGASSHTRYCWSVISILNDSVAYNHALER